MLSTHNSLSHWLVKPVFSQLIVVFRPRQPLSLLSLLLVPYAYTILYRKLKSDPFPHKNIIQRYSSISNVADWRKHLDVSAEINSPTLTSLEGLTNGYEYNQLRARSGKLTSWYRPSTLKKGESSPTPLSQRKSLGKKNYCNFFYKSFPFFYLRSSWVWNHLLVSQRQEQWDLMMKRSTTNRILALRVPIERKRGFRQGCLHVIQSSARRLHRRAGMCIREFWSYVVYHSNWLSWW